MISTVTYNGDGATRVFPVAFEIKGEDYAVVWIDDVAVNDRTKYDIINNSIVFSADYIPAAGTCNVKVTVASSPTEIGDLNAPPSTVQVVVDNITGLNQIVSSVIPNLPEILLADDNASIATQKAREASTSASEALAYKNSAQGYSANATTKANEASTSALSASSSATSADEDATTATTQAGIATTKASEASASATNAEAEADRAQGYADSINPLTLVRKDSSTGAIYIPVGTTAQRPSTPSNGYMRYNTDITSMEVYSNGSWGSVGGGAKGGGSNAVFFENDKTVTTDYAITSGKNAMSAGAITINNGVTVTIPSGSVWTVI